MPLGERYGISDIGFMESRIESADEAMTQLTHVGLACQSSLRL